MLMITYLQEKVTKKQKKSRTHSKQKFDIGYGSAAYFLGVRILQDEETRKYLDLANRLRGETSQQIWHASLKKC